MEKLTPTRINLARGGILLGDLMIVFLMTLLFTMLIGYLPLSVIPEPYLTKGKLIFFYMFLFMTYVESSRQQGTYIKTLAKLKVTDKNGMQISLKQSAIRNAVKILPIAMLFYEETKTIAWIVIIISIGMGFFTESKQFLHDKIAGTYVKQIENYAEFMEERKNLFVLKHKFLLFQIFLGIILFSIIIAFLPAIVAGGIVILVGAIILYLLFLYFKKVDKNISGNEPNEVVVGKVYAYGTKNVLKISKKSERDIVQKEDGSYYSRGEFGAFAFEIIEANTKEEMKEKLYAYHGKTPLFGEQEGCRIEWY